MAKILVVEDDRVQQVLMMHTLEKLGHRVILTNDTLNFETFVKNNIPDLILMDLDLRYRNGIVLIYDMYRDSLLQSIPIIVFTDSSTNNIRPKLTQLGCVGFMDKPFHPQKLTDLLAQAM